jgi:GDP-D-mannose 3',5'-epimerase
MKKILVCGAGGFIGSHLVTRLREAGHYVIGADIKYPEFSTTNANKFTIVDLRNQTDVVRLITSDIDEIYQLAADMGGANYIFTGVHDADIMSNSSLININILQAMVLANVKRVFFASSACIYPEENQLDSANPNCEESSAYPAHPDSEYGWEKIFSERLYMAYNKNYGIECRIARFHNIYGPEGTWDGGKEKAPAALCRKISMATDKGTIEIWGDGNQTRSFLYIDECITGIIKLMQSDIKQPINIGSEEMISINDLAYLIMKISGKQLSVKHINGPLGVRGRSSDNKLIRQLLKWEPNYPLIEGIKKTFEWIDNKVNIRGLYE